MRSRTTVLMLPLAVLALAALCLVAAPATRAASSAYEQVLKDYRDDGKIDPCKFSDKTLRDAQGQIPANIEQFAPDFPTALGDAITKRTQGRCAGKGSGSTAPPATTTPPSTTPTTPPTQAAPPAQTTPPAQTAPPTQTTPPEQNAPPVQTAPGGRAAPASGEPASPADDSPSVWLIVLIVVGALVVLAWLLYFLGRWMGWDGRRLAGARQDVDEAAYRASGTWSDFRDWLRLGR
jgi:hypothetical protein